MKNAPTTNSNKSALDKCNYISGILPTRVNTLQSSVLASLLDGNKLTGLGSVFANDTTRLAAVIHSLKKNYCWEFEKADKPIETNDGRNVTVTEYSLHDSAINHALENGAPEWIKAVLDSLNERRKQSSKSKAKTKTYTNKSCLADPRQISLWGA